MSSKFKKSLGWILIHQIMTALILLMYLIHGQTFIYSYGIGFLLASCLFGLSTLIGLIFAYLID